MVGNAQDIHLILDGEVPVFMYGSARKVYLVDGIIYKVERYFGANSTEWTAYLKHMENGLPIGVAIPETSMHIVDGQEVIAMRFIEGEAMAECFCIEGMEECMSTCLPPADTDLARTVISDVGGFNVIRNGDTLWIIDLDA